MQVGIWQSPRVENVKLNLDLHNQSFEHRHMCEPKLRRPQNETKKHLCIVKMSVGPWQILKVDTSKWFETYQFNYYRDETCVKQLYANHETKQRSTVLKFIRQYSYDTLQKYES